MTISDSWQFAVIVAQIVSAAAVTIGLLVAIWTIYYNVTTAKKVHTSVFLYESRYDKDYLSGQHALRQIHMSGKSFRAYIFPTNGGDLTPKRAGTLIIKSLNGYPKDGSLVL